MLLFAVLFVFAIAPQQGHYPQNVTSTKYGRQPANYRGYNGQQTANYGKYGRLPANYGRYSRHPAKYERSNRRPANYGRYSRQPGKQSYKPRHTKAASKDVHLYPTYDEGVPLVHCHFNKNLVTCPNKSLLVCKDAPVTYYIHMAEGFFCEQHPDNTVTLIG